MHHAQRTEFYKARADLRRADKRGGSDGDCGARTSRLQQAGQVRGHAAADEASSGEYESEDRHRPARLRQCFALDL
jgi:hypothetical protein